MTRALQRAARRMVRRHGRDATLRNYTLAEESEYGERWVLTDDSPRTIRVLSNRSGAGFQLERDSRSVEIDPDRVVYALPTGDYGDSYGDSYTLGKGFRDGGGDGASEIDIDGATYVTMIADDLQNGVFRLMCERVDSEP